MHLNSPRAAGVMLFLVPALLAGLSLLLGQDSNWDLFNYHLYNAYAYLNDKSAADLAPAGTQSYFNPLLDIGYWYLITSAWPPLTGIVLGGLQGLHFVLLYAISRHVLASSLPPGDEYRVPLLLALAGCLTANFLAGLGTTMGDNLTSLFQLAALLLLVSRAGSLHVTSPGPAWRVLIAGVASGLGAGLKLTNAVYALALLSVLLIVGGPPRSRMRHAAAFAGGAVLGFLVTGGYWHLEMWQRFGNPLYPQFGSLFPHPLAAPIGALDRRWLPHGLLEFLAWPFVISYDAGRAGELEMRQISWAVWYGLLLAWLARRSWSPSRALSREALEPPAALVLAFVGVAFVIWAAVFGVYRYVVPMETLLPLAIWLLLGRLFSYAHARRYAKWTIVACVAVVVLPGWNTWGHVRWETPAFEIEAPQFDDPARHTVVVAEHPLAWLAVGFPPEVAFASVLSSFPESPRYAERLREIIRQRGGDAHVMLMARRNRRADTVVRVNRLFADWGLRDSPAACAALDWLLANTRLHATLEFPTGSRAPCALGLRPEDQKDLEAADREALRDIGARIEPYGLTIEPGSCETYSARYGDAMRPYRLCRADLSGASP